MSSWNKDKYENVTLSASVKKKKKKPIGSEIGKHCRTFQKLFFCRDILEKALRNRAIPKK